MDMPDVHGKPALEQEGLCITYKWLNALQLRGI